MPHEVRRSPRGRAHRWLVAATVAVPLLATGCQVKEDGVAAAQPAAAAAAPAASPGEEVYRRSCARCHGANMQGKGNSPKIDQPSLASLGDQRLRITIASGKGKMPGFSKLSPSQVDALISYLKAVA